MAAVSAGTVLGWTSPVIPQIQLNETGIYDTNSTDTLLLNKDEGN